LRFKGLYDVDIYNQTDKMKKTKAFIGPLNTANAANGFADSLKSVGIKANYWSWSIGNHPFGYKKDKVMFLFNDPPPFRIFNKNLFFFINIVLRYIHFARMLISYNTFIFISPGTLLKKQKDLPIMRLLKKKVIFAFMGSVERDPNFEKDQEDWVCNNCKDFEKRAKCFCDDIPRKKKVVRKMEYYSDFIISQDQCASFLEKKNPIWFYIFSQDPPQEDYLEKQKNKKIKIVHFPSNSLAKQSHKIVPVLERIQNERDDIEIVIKSGIPHKEVLEELKTSHILVDQLATGYGVLGLEAMSRGCVVLNRNADWFVRSVPESPIYSTSSVSLYDNINSLIDNRSVLKKYAKKSIKFYKDFHSTSILGKYYKNKLNL